MTVEFNRQLVEQMPRLRRYALSLTRNAHDADDLIQMTAVQALRAEGQFIPGTNFAAWIATILRNRFMSSCRSTRNRTLSIDDVPEMALASPQYMDDSVMAGEVIRAMEHLTPRMREMLGLICCKGLSYNDAAAALSCSVGTVKSRLWRARQQIVALVLQEDPDVGALPAALPRSAKERRDQVRADRAAPYPGQAATARAH